MYVSVWRLSIMKPLARMHSKNQNTYLILTLDYELWGDGSGNVFEQIIEPTEKILNICGENNIKITIFFETIEYLKIKEEWEKGNSMGYVQNPIKAIEKQLQKAALNGHDIQLHIHPQWVNARYINDKWEVDFSKWRLGDFKIDSGYSIEDLLRNGKKTLENLIIPVIPEYKCIALRAGGFNIMPSKELFTAMQNLGLKIDSSVYPGGFANGNLSRYDYRNIPLDLDFWWAHPDNITKQSHNRKEIMEIPIFALMERRWKKILKSQIIETVFSRSNPVISSVAKENFSNKTLYEKIKYLFNKEAFTWDFCMFTTSMHKIFFNYIEKNQLNKQKLFVLIGHSKSLTNDNVFRSFLELTRRRNYLYTFKTLNEIYAENNHHTKNL